MNPGNQILKLFGRVLDQSIDQLDCMPCRLRASSETKHQNMLIQKYVLKKKRNLAKKKGFKNMSFIILPNNCPPTVALGSAPHTKHQTQKSSIHNIKLQNYTKEEVKFLDVLIFPLHTEYSIARRNFVSHFNHSFSFQP